MFELILFIVIIVLVLFAFRKTMLAAAPTSKEPVKNPVKVPAPQTKSATPPPPPSPKKKKTARVAFAPTVKVRMFDTKGVEDVPSVPLAV
jgi:hypothetical protein